MPRPGGLDVLAQHLLLTAAAGSLHPDDMFEEVRQAAPYAMITRQDFDDVLGFVENGGYALAAYDRYRKLFRDAEGVVHIRSERIARMARMNLGTIVEAPLLKVRYAGRGGPSLGEIEESFVNMMPPGATFMFAGRLLKFLRMRETTVEVSDGGDGEPMVPAYAGARQPLTTNLAARVRSMLHDHGTWHLFPAPVQEWLELQRERSELPGPEDLLVETFPRNGRWYLRRLLLRGPQRAPDAGHAADPADGALRLRAARLRRHRLRHRNLVRARADRRRRAVRAGHAGRRSGGLDGREQHASPDFSKRRRHLRARRAATSRDWSARANRSPSTRTSSTTSCAATSRITSCCGPHARTRPAG